MVLPLKQPEALSKFARGWCAIWKRKKGKKFRWSNADRVPDIHIYTHPRSLHPGFSRLPKVSRYCKQHCIVLRHLSCIFLSSIPSSIHGIWPHLGREGIKRYQTCLKQRRLIQPGSKPCTNSTSTCFIFGVAWRSEFCCKYIRFIEATSSIHVAKVIKVIQYTSRETTYLYNASDQFNYFC